MSLRLLHYSDIENAFDYPERIGRLAGAIDARRDDRTLVLGTGDNTAPGVLALETTGRHALDFFAAVDPDAETFGNHDFDFGPATTREIVADSPQQWLSANVYEPDGQRRFDGVAPGVVVERNGVRVGLLGLTAPETPSMCPAATDLVFTDPFEAARETVTDLRAAGVDAAVVLSHLGRDDDKLARAVDADVILGGHAHSERCEWVDGTLLTRPGANGAVLWEVRLGEDGIETTRHDVTDAPVDESVADALRERMDETGLSEVVTTVSEPLVRELDRRYGGENRFANFVTDAYRWYADADIGFSGSGALRDGPPLSGAVTVADLIGLSPFTGVLQTTEVSGAALRGLVESVATPPAHADDRRWFGHFSGLEIVWNRETMELVELTYAGNPVALDATYTLATSEFFVQYEALPAPTPDDVVAEHGVQFDALVAYAREYGIPAECDGRLRDV